MEKDVNVCSVYFPLKTSRGRIHKMILILILSYRMIFLNLWMNTYGRVLSNLCITNKLCFLNGRTRGDRLGNFTCFAYNGANVVDYAVVGHDVYHICIYVSYILQYIL